MQPKKTVLKRGAYIYLFAEGVWYCYNPAEMPLGSGAMGDVYLGFRCDDGVKVAIKRVKDYFANNPMIRQRACQEASLAFRHPNLVEMLGYCEYAPDRGPIWIISKYVQGDDADKYVAAFPNTHNRAEKICRLIMPVMDALAYIHQKGVVHRDIKPSNIMVENGNNVRLMDLGISRVNGGNKFSQYGFIGTPQYSSPEQIKRDESSGAESINGRSDIYELGITLYELITGSNPMDKGNDTETLAAQISEKLPPSDKIPPQLMRVIWKATEKDQMKRFQTVKEFKQAITMALTYQPTTMEKTMEWAKQNKALAAIMVFLAICAMAMVIVLPFIINQQ